MCLLLPVMTKSETMTTNRFPKLYPFDWLIVGYSVLMIVVLLLFGRPFESFTDEFATYVLTAFAPFAIIKLTHNRTSVIARALRWLYPVILFTPFYRLTGSQMFLLFDHFFDAQLVAFETALFGIEPTLYIDQFLLHPIFTDIVTFCYICYYPMIPVFVFMVFRYGKLDVLADATTAMCLMFFTSYLLFFLFPIEGPRWFQVPHYINQVRGFVFRPLVEFIQHKGAVHGGGMPSSHTGVALVITMYTYRLNKQWGLILAVIVTGLGIGALWGRYHYISDIIVGAVIGVLSVYIADKFLRSKVETMNTRQTDRSAVAHVS